MKKSIIRAFINYKKHYLPWLLAFALITYVYVDRSVYVDNPVADPCGSSTLAFKTSTTHILVHQTSTCSYQPLFIKGVNIGIGTPGTYAGELAVGASYSDFMRWFQLMSDAGINTVRIFTLHMSVFYDAFYDYNSQREHQGLEPLYLLHGVWLDEVSGGTDLYTSDVSMSQNIKQAVDAVHGQLSQPPRRGRGFGNYTANVEKWTLGWIIGRELNPGEIAATNANNASQTHYNGRLSLPSGNPSEVWLTGKMDELINYEYNTYNTMRPVSYTNWPTLDPLYHATEHLAGNRDFEDSQQIDLSNLDSSDSAGVFISFNAYPYYPDFISEEPQYQQSRDDQGYNSYLGYLIALKQHYQGMPVLIAEFGVPSSWGSGHSSHSGMSHGGADEQTQGEQLIRMMNNISQAEMAGGVMFAWLDEWWKQAWITNVFDFPFERRAFWHNIMSPEQNFGLIGFHANTPTLTDLDISGGKVSAIKAAADATFYRLQLTLGNSLTNNDEILIAFDTYDLADQKVGETQIHKPFSAFTKQPITTLQGSEFLLKIHHDGLVWRANLYVTEAYDLQGYANRTHDKNTQKLRSVMSDSNSWKPIMWTTNYTDYGSLANSFYGAGDHSEYAAGELQVRGALTSTKDSKDSIVISDNTIDIAIPWSLLHFTDPSQSQVYHLGDAITSEGIANAIIFNGVLEAETPRFSWPHWNPPSYTEYLKDSYNIVKRDLEDIEPSRYTP